MTLFVSRLSDVPAVLQKGIRAVPDAKHLVFAEGLPVEAVASRVPRLNIRDAQRLHIARESEPTEIVDMLFRVFNGILNSQHPRPIVDAWVEPDALVLLSPSFERLSVPLRLLSVLIGEDPGEIKSFEIDEDGSFLFWPHADVHLGWEQFEQLVDPAAAIAAQQQSEEFNARYGAAIRQVREEHGLRQSDIRGVTDRNLRRAEHGEIAASRSLLSALAEAHGLKLDAYLKDLADRLRCAQDERAES